MVFKKAPFLSLAAFLVLVLPAASQVIPAALEPSEPLSVGLGASIYSLDYVGDGNNSWRPIDGATLWIDWQFTRIPHYLNGVGVEAEVRDLSKWGPKELSKGYGSYNCVDGALPPNCEPNPSGLRADTAEGGLLYTWHRYARIHPFGKLLAGFGNMDFPATDAHYPSGRLYTHDTRTFFALGGGLEYRLKRKIDIRAEYEYQFWPTFLGYNFVQPNGVSIGVLYSFKPYYPHAHHY